MTKKSFTARNIRRTNSEVVKAKRLSQQAPELAKNKLPTPEETTYEQTNKKETDIRNRYN